MRDTLKRERPYSEKPAGAERITGTIMVEMATARTWSRHDGVARLTDAFSSGPDFNTDHAHAAAHAIKVAIATAKPTVH